MHDHGWWQTIDPKIVTYLRFLLLGKTTGLVGENVCDS